jgi:oligoendopeptidase F
MKRRDILKLGLAGLFAGKGEKSASAQDTENPEAKFKEKMESFFNKAESIISELIVQSNSLNEEVDRLFKKFQKHDFTSPLPRTDLDNEFLDINSKYNKLYNQRYQITEDVLKIANLARSKQLEPKSLNKAIESLLTLIKLLREVKEKIYQIKNFATYPVSKNV